MDDTVALPETITFVTGNAGKVAEMEAHLAPLGIKVIQDDRGYPEIQADTLQEVAKAGADALVASGLEPPFILEDAGLFVHALRGFPGVYSAYAQKTIGNQGILHLLHAVEPELRQAHFEACLTYVGPKGGTQFTGAVHGHIHDRAEGTDGFGYDPIFIPKGKQATFAQMDATEKTKISHRGHAISQFLTWLSNQ